MTSTGQAKCGTCGWVHFEISLQEAQAHTDEVNAALPLNSKPVSVERYFACSRCGASSATFVPAAPCDAPPLSTLRGIVLLSNEELLLTVTAFTVTSDPKNAHLFTKEEATKALKHLPAKPLLSNDEHEFEPITPAQHAVIAAAAPARGGRVVSSLLPTGERTKCEVCVFEHWQDPDGRIIRKLTCTVCGASSVEEDMLSTRERTK